MNGAPVLLAAAKMTDALIILGAAFGAMVTLLGLASLDPRIRARVPVAAIARGNTLVAVGLIVAGLMVVGMTLGA